MIRNFFVSAGALLALTAGAFGASLVSAAPANATSPITTPFGVSTKQCSYLGVDFPGVTFDVFGNPYLGVDCP